MGFTKADVVQVFGEARVKVRKPANGKKYDLSSNQVVSVILANVLS